MKQKNKMRFLVEFYKICDYLKIIQRYFKRMKYRLKTAQLKPSSLKSINV